MKSTKNLHYVFRGNAKRNLFVSTLGVGVGGKPVGRGCGGWGGGVGEESNIKCFLFLSLKATMMGDFSYFFWSDHLSVISKSSKN